ncbi:MAG: hypothetical protein IJU78_02540 [Clostridia bacterium]|nr:hypothetical protein [Clostridia bacterium]
MLRKQALKSALENMKIQPVGNGLIDLICHPDCIDAFIDCCNEKGAEIKGFTWWCHVTDGHEPCGMGGPISEYYGGWFSEIFMRDIIKLTDNESYRDYFTNIWPADKEFHACYWPGFWLEE